ncbi:SOS response-associated peptidase [Egbenema bharatensis]|uniref:SOS response-associated peptidase n=1 Tax=Egbenema bharatensis TaxID=3463334 RepID=UPI003A8B1290
MCGRFTLTQSGETIARMFDLEEVPTIPPRYNIAPTQPIAVIRSSTPPGTQQPEREFTYLTWGLVPSWAKDPGIGARMINARAETVAEKPSFRAAFKRRRCLILADGFYEWQRSPEGKQPYYFHLNHHEPFAFGGLWEHWENGNGDVIESCTILTTTANDVLTPVHDRMPVILSPDGYDLWLDPTVETHQDLPTLLRPYADDAMVRYPVSSTVNNPRHDRPECIHPLED